MARSHGTVSISSVILPTTPTCTTCTCHGTTYPILHLSYFCMQDGFEVLRGAIDTGNTYLLQELVQASTAATAKHDQLHRAVYAGHFEAARFLIIYGAETQLAYTWDMSKVHCVSMIGIHGNIFILLVLFTSLL